MVGEDNILDRKPPWLIIRFGVDLGLIYVNKCLEEVKMFSLTSHEIRPKKDFIEGIFNK